VPPELDLKTTPVPGTFKTVAGPAEGHYREKGSRFLSFVWPIQDEEQAGHLLEGLRKKYHDASHICYAWVLGEEGSQCRAYDAGEPRHTAGEPILGQIRARGLTFVLVAVVRYFGGTRLGTGGLAAAYRQAAAYALEQATIVEKQVMRSARLRCSYAALNRAMHFIHEHRVHIRHKNFAAHCEFDLEVSVARFKPFVEQVLALRFMGYDVAFLEEIP